MHGSDDMCLPTQIMRAMGPRLREGDGLKGAGELDEARLRGGDGKGG